MLVPLPSELDIVSPFSSRQTIEMLDRREPSKERKDIVEGGRVSVRSKWRGRVSMSSKKMKEKKGKKKRRKGERDEADGVGF